MIPGDQVELTCADIIDDPSEYCGSVWVDIDPDTQTVQVSTGKIPESEAPIAEPTSPVSGLQDGYKWNDSPFTTATVNITGAGFESLTTVSDTLWGMEVLPKVPAAPEASLPSPDGMNLVQVVVSGEGAGFIAWSGQPDTDMFPMNTPGAALCH